MTVTDSALDEGAEQEFDDDLAALFEDADSEETAALEEEINEEVELSPTDAAFVQVLVEKVMLFTQEFTKIPLFPYQGELAERVVESVLINDGEEITALFSRQSGKTETLADILAALMVLLPKLALIFPDYEPLQKFRRGFWVGVFGPVEDQAQTIFGRIVDRLTSDDAAAVFEDPEIDDGPVGGGKFLKLRKSGSFCRMQTANPRAKIESKSYHFILIDEAQDADDFTVRKSIHPMGAFYNATIVKIGTPTTRKGDFFKAIRHNKRRQTRGARRNHFEFNWRYCARHNKNYAKYVRKEMRRLGVDSDEFQMAYELKWLLERGMFTTESDMDALGDKSMQVVKQWMHTPVVVGIDPARTTDSTVVTVVWVGWDRPDEFGYYEHRIMNWLEIHGDKWEAQYAEIVGFLANYNVWAVAVDKQGMGGPVAERLEALMPNVQVVGIESTWPEQSNRWKHLQALMGRSKVGWPAHAKTRRLRVWRRFFQQMIDLEKQYHGPHLIAAAPDEAEAHDDYPDSLALACVLTKESIMPEVEESESPFVSRSR